MEHVNAEDVRSGDLITLKVLRKFHPLGSNAVVAFEFELPKNAEEPLGGERTIVVAKDEPITMALTYLTHRR